MIEIEIPFGDRGVSTGNNFSGRILARLPEGSEILRMAEPEPLNDPASSLCEALARPIGSKSLAAIAAEKMIRAHASKRIPHACIVVSDNTRPVPYKGPNGILMPVIRTLLSVGFAPQDICILVATGTHRAMTRSELETMLGIEPFELGLEVVLHDCHDETGLVYIGTTARGTVAKINRRYVEADLKILTGLVESHFMAGASGGRKAICPGIFGEQGTFIFHSAALMAHPNARDLQLEGNPVHEESLAVAKMAGVDFIVNVTIDGSFRITGIFCGDLEAAHTAAVARLKSYVGIPVKQQYDLVVTHGGFVAVNHYQAAKAAVASIGALKAGGSLILVANNSDPNPVGSDRYRTVLAMLKLVGAEALDRALSSPDWPFIPEQWQVQEWAKVFKHISMQDFIYFAPQLDSRDWRDLPGIDGRILLSSQSAHAKPSANDIPAIIDAAVANFLKKRNFTLADVASGRCRIAYLADGPYGIPIYAGDQP
ncbi:MAG: nickel-dependent lactate racemase [Spirochaetaceae bacterium]|nr:nickel-dependent lactate racemase [Spirochaetaceae bacterium]